MATSYTSLNNPIIIPLCKVLDLSKAPKQLYNSICSTVRIQQKFDGIRALFVRQTDGSYTPITRKGNVIKSIPHLCNEIAILNTKFIAAGLPVIDTLDCELLCDSLPFAELNGLIRRQYDSPLSTKVYGKVIAINNQSELTDNLSNPRLHSDYLSLIATSFIQYKDVKLGSLPAILKAINLAHQDWEGVVFKSGLSDNYSVSAIDCKNTPEVRLSTWYKYKFRHEGIFKLISYSIGKTGKVKGMVNTITVMDSNKQVAVIGSGLSKSLSDTILAQGLAFSNCYIETEYETAIGPTLRGAVIKSIITPDTPEHSTIITTTFKHSRK